MNPIPLYIRLRGAVFHEAGFSLDAPALRKDQAAFFVINDAQGKAQRTERVPGCEGAGEGTVLVHLHPYGDASAAVPYLMLAACHLQKALNGDPSAKSALGQCWIKLVMEGVKPDKATRYKAMCALFGVERMQSALHGKTFSPLDVKVMVDEALGLQAT